MFLHCKGSKGKSVEPLAFSLKIHFIYNLNLIRESYTLLSNTCSEDKMTIFQNEVEVKN